MKRFLYIIFLIFSFIFAATGCKKQYYVFSGEVRSSCDPVAYYQKFDDMALKRKTGEIPCGSKVVILKTLEVNKVQITFIQWNGQEVLVAANNVVDAKEKDKREKIAKEAEVKWGSQDKAVLEGFTDILKELSNFSNSVDPYLLVTAIVKFQFQFTSPNENTSAWVFSNLNNEKYGVREKYFQASRDRSSSRINAFWEKNKPSFFSIIKSEDYQSMCNRTYKYSVDRLLSLKQSSILSAGLSCFPDQIAGRPTLYSVDRSCFESKNINPDQFSFHEFLFWKRRISERNDAVVYKILQEIQNYYGKCQTQS